MNLLLLSGGSGKRLWPLSNETRSKQFLMLFKNEKGNFESMIQRVYGQIKKAGIDANIVIATGESQVASIVNQLGNSVEVVVEPDRRDTFPAIALACTYLACEKNISLDEVVVAMPVDPYADLSYFTTAIEMEKAVKEGKGDMALMGITPTYPSAKYGYIISDDNVPGKVLRFIEKPTETEAQQLIEKGALWNGGVFAFKLKYIIDIVNKYIKVNSYKELYDNYEKLNKISFDYEVVEKVQSAVMLPYEGQWKDLGTWNTVTEQMAESVLGNGVIVSDTCTNTHVINELGIPILVTGIKDAIVAASPGGILVSDKHQSSYIKPMVDMIVDKPVKLSGSENKVLDYVTYENENKSLTKSVNMKAGYCSKEICHKYRDEIWVVLNGEGEITIGGITKPIKYKDIFEVKRNTPHSIRAISDLNVIQVLFGKDLMEENSIATNVHDTNT